MYTDLHKLQSLLKEHAYANVWTRISMDMYGSVCIYVRISVYITNATDCSFSEKWGKE